MPSPWPFPPGSNVPDKVYEAMAHRTHMRVPPFALLLALVLVPLVEAHGASVEADLNDPSGDVYEGQVTAGRAPSEFRYQRVGGHPDVDILQAASHAQSGTVVLTLQVSGAIRDQVSGAASGGNFSGGGFAYEFALDTYPGNGTEYTVTYSGGHASLVDPNRSNATQVAATTDGDTLTVTVPLAALGEVDEWALSVAATETEIKFQRASYTSLSYVDVLGVFPGYEQLETEEKHSLPGPGASLGLVAATVVALWAARRRA